MNNKILQFPQQTKDVKEMMLDGNERGHDVLRRYCEYICAHGCPGGATKALAEIDGLAKGDDAAWIRRTFARYVKDQNALMEYVMRVLA